MGAGLLAKAVDQSTSMLNVMAPSRASPLPQVSAPTSGNELSVIFRHYRPHSRHRGSGNTRRESAAWSPS
ncbi:hypothetical protein C5612_20565 [Pseudomonas frederiksbergensis]|uniref:Uncharacterized protein n=1 Tax=Pseudomonas frederiksbergensis TaxID=104087 RepID=A0A2S8HFL1_9PSED|nr:hypothetical protein C5612_20565 [Pseudomonas frederiksbergensis]